MRVATIGGGFAALALLHQCVAQGLALDEFRIVEPGAELGTGVAYGRAGAEALLNTRAGNMGIDPDQPDAFAVWAGLAAAGRDSFQARRRYAAYLQDHWMRLRERAGFPVRWQRATALAVARCDAGFAVRTSTGTFTTDALVLALGALPAPPLGMVDPLLAQRGTCVEDVWNPAWQQQVASDAHVLVLGTGLTMVDQVQRLRARGHRGPVTALSRRGQLPHAHAVHGVHGGALPPALLPVLREGSLRAIVAAVTTAARSPGSDWRALLDALRPHHRALWHRFDDAERRRFLRHLRPWWDTHRHRLAPESAAALEQLRREGTLRIAAGQLLQARAAGDRIAVRVRHRGETRPREMEVDLLLRATGFCLDVVRGGSELLGGLLQAGLASADPLGLGLCADAGYRSLGADGTAVPSLYVLGPLLAGRHWEATAVPDIRDDARALARCLSALSPRRCADPPAACDAGPDGR